VVVHKVVCGCVDVMVWERFAGCWRLARYPWHGGRINGERGGEPEVVGAAGQ